MKLRYFHISIFILLCQLGFGQQDGLFTQFAYNKLSYNPAYASQINYAEVGILFRDQWNGLEGAPMSQQVSGVVPFKKYRMGIGALVSKESIGIQESINLRTMYSYTVPTDFGNLSGGLEISLRSHSLDFTDDRLVAFETIGADPNLNNQTTTSYLFNTGLGFYFKNQTFFASVSVPRLLSNGYIDNNLSESREERHLYVMAGTEITINSSFDFLPQILFKLAPNSPYDFDIQAGILYNKEYHIGINYRTGGNKNSLGESMSLLLGLQPLERFFLGLSYDVTFSQLRRYETGSLEAMIRYTFGNNNPKEILTNPRYF